jgi:2-polyprenyl-3-methyl-5-hydroxy-6-metoxy-1,4-benzoquinol methylase
MTAELQNISASTAERFAETIAGIIDQGAVAVSLSLGHRTGLFDTMSDMAPAGSLEIATAADLAERYVREWLAVMVTGGVVDYDPETSRYHLPAERAACLTRDAALGNLAIYAQHVALMGEMQSRTIACFETGEGTGYGDYPCFHQIMAEDSGQTVAEALFDHVLPLAAGIEDRLADGIEVLDAGCGRGLVLIEMAKRYPSSRFTGYDLCGDAIDWARAAARRLGLANVTFEARDLTGFAEPGRFDFITSFDAIHDQKDPEGLIHGLKASLKPGGTYLVQDIGGSARLENNLDFPMASLLYAISLTHCTPVSIGQGGEGLGTMWGWETAEAMLCDAGFAAVDRHVLPHDPLNVWFVARA